MQKLFEVLGTKVLGSDHPALLLNLLSQPQTDCGSGSVSPKQDTLHWPTNEEKQAPGCHRTRSLSRSMVPCTQEHFGYAIDSFLQPTTPTHDLCWLHVYWFIDFLTRQQKDLISFLLTHEKR